ncbi:MAG: protease modulator HflC [Spirochaetales bacterium]
MKKLVTVLVVVAVVLIVFLAFGPFFVLEEGEQAVVTRFGEVVNVHTEAGLKFKTPLVDNVTRYSARILPWDGSAQRMPTSERQFVWVDTTARWRIADPELFYASVTTVQEAFARMDEIIDSSVRNVIAANPLAEVVRSTNLINETDRPAPISAQERQQLEGLEEIASLIDIDNDYETIEAGREALSQNMLEFARSQFRDNNFGIELIDVVIRQIRYSDELTESVFDRMVAERNQIASAYRSYGEGQKQNLLGRAENDQEAILSRAYATAEDIRGEADAIAARTYSQAYAQAPSFFEFWRSIESYRETLPQFRKTLTTDMEYFEYLYNAEGQ